MTITPAQLRESAARQRAAAPGGATVPLADELEAAAAEIERLTPVDEPVAFAVIEEGHYEYVSLVDGLAMAVAAENGPGAKVVPLYDGPHLTSADADLVILRVAVRRLLDGVNIRNPDKNPREWTCPHMAALDRLVPPSGDE